MRVERPDRIFLHTEGNEIIDIEPKNNLDLFKEELTDFINAVSSGAKPEADARVGAEMTFLVEAARTSSETGERVKVQW